MYQLAHWRDEMSYDMIVVLHLETSSSTGEALRLESEPEGLSLGHLHLRKHHEGNNYYVLGIID